MDNEKIDINLAIEDFRDSLMTVLNSSHLPVSVIYYVMSNIYDSVALQYKNYIEQARMAIKNGSEIED
jgi:hypothetical protein